MFDPDFVFPQMYRIRQRIFVPELKDVKKAVRDELAKLNLPSIVKPGARIAITGGSRGYDNYQLIIREIVSALRNVGARPFVIPAMGCHGGASAEGQAAILEKLKITAETVGAPIISSLEVVKLGETADGIPVYVDKLATEADWVVPINRIKPHTGFDGEIGSGIHKMLAVGIGKYQGAKLVHRYAFQRGYEHTVTTVGEYILKKLPILFAFGTVENIYSQTCHVEAILPEDIPVRERELLAMARNLMGKLPFDIIDALIIDEMGKNIIGTGIYTKTIGRLYSFGQKEPIKPRITRIAVLDLTDETRGNAIGVGLADFITERLRLKIDYRATFLNGITAYAPEKIRIPAFLPTDRETVAAALETSGCTLNMERSRVVHIRNTSSLEVMDVSTGLLDEVMSNPGLEILEGPFPLEFDESGNLKRMP